MEVTSVKLSQEGNSLQNVSANSINPGVTRDSGENANIGILWLPYLLMTLVLVGMAAGSFIKYHCRNKGKYRGKRYLSADPKVYHKHRVTMNKNGTMPLQANPGKVISELPRTNTPDLIRSNRWQYPLYPNYKHRYEPSGKFVIAGYFLDKLAERRKSRPFSYLNPGFVKSSPKINRLYVTRDRQSSIDENPTSATTTSSVSQWNQYLQGEISGSNSTETEFQYPSEPSPPVAPKINVHPVSSNNVAPPPPPKRNAYNINRYKVNLHHAPGQVHQHVEEDSGYHSNHLEHDVDGQNIHFHGNNLPFRASAHPMPYDPRQYSSKQPGFHGYNGCQGYAFDPGLHRGDCSNNSSASSKTEHCLSWNSACPIDSHSNERGNLVAMESFPHGDSCSALLELTATNLMLAHHQQTLKSRAHHVAMANTHHHGDGE